MSCDHCGRPAECYGRYQGRSAFACGVCCGHGCENGWCVPLKSAPPDPENASRNPHTRHLRPHTYHA